MVSTTAFLGSVSPVIIKHEGGVGNPNTVVFLFHQSQCILKVSPETSYLIHGLFKSM